jgi:hypothetical protein
MHDIGIDNVKIDSLISENEKYLKEIKSLTSDNEMLENVK